MEINVYRNVQKLILIILFVAYCFLFFSSVTLYEESKWIYTLFSISFLLMFFYSFYGLFSYAYLFVSFFLVLGFFVKISFHLLLNYPYIEPVGSFYINKTSMDEVLILATIGSLSIIISKAVINFLLKNNYLIFKDKIKKGKIFNLILKTNFKVIWSSIIILTIFLAFLNIVYSIQQIGIVPRTILIWPLNAVIFWFLITGVTFLLAFLMKVEKDIKYYKKMIVYCLYLTIVMLCSVSILSRGQFVYVSIAFLMVFLINYSFFNKIKIKGYLFLIFFVFILIVLNTQLVTLLRNEFYGISTESNSLYTLKEVANFSVGIKVIQQLFVDRWLGLEGLMAVVSYEHKDIGLFFNEFIRNPKIGESGIFNSISNAHYKDIDLTTYNFTALPGFFGFLYFSGYETMFIFLIIFFICLVLFLELLIKNKLDNEYITSSFGMFLANAIVAMSGSFYLAIKFWFLLFIFFIIMYLLSSYYFDKLYFRLKK